MRRVKFSIIWTSNVMYVSAKVVGQLGMWGFLISGIQSAALEHKGMKTATWNGATGEIRIYFTSEKIELSSVTVGILLAYTACASLLSRKQFAH